MLCVVSMVTTIVISIDFGAHDNLSGLFFFGISIFRLIRIYIIEQCNKLFLIRVDLVNCYFFMRLSMKKRMLMKKLKYVN
jgi:hypothetical protein